MHLRRSRKRAINDFPGDANLGDFSCSVDDYRDFLVNDAPKFSELNLTRVKLLLDRETGNIIAYMALLRDAIQLALARTRFCRKLAA